MKTLKKRKDLKTFDVIVNQPKDAWIGIYIDENTYIGYRVDANTKGCLVHATANATYDVVCNLEDVMISMKAQPLDGLQKGHGEYTFGVLSDGRVRLTLSKGKDITYSHPKGGLIFIRASVQWEGHENKHPMRVIAPMGKVLEALWHHHRYSTTGGNINE